MSLKEFKLAYGHGTQSVMLPEEHNISLTSSKAYRRPPAT